MEIMMRNFRLSSLILVILLFAGGCSDPIVTSELAHESVPLFSQAQAKVDVCHVNGDGSYSRITVADAAYATHLDHGDQSPGGDVPGSPGYVFDADCRAIALPSTAVGPDGGIVVGADDKLELSFSEGALTEEVSIVVQEVSDPVNSPGMAPGLVFRLLPSGTEFAAPVTLTVRYDPDALGALDPNLLRIQKLVDGDWVQVEGSTVNTADNTVTATLHGFSVYGVGVKVHRVPPVTVTSLSHSFWKDEWDWDNQTYIHDAVYFGSGPGTAGSYLSEGFTAAIGTGEIIVVRIQAPSGYRFQVTRHRTAPFQGFFSNTIWHTGISDWSSLSAPPSITFENLDGPAPETTYIFARLSNAGQAVGVTYHADVIDDFSFTAVEFALTVSHPVDAVPRTYSAVGTSSSPSFGSGARGEDIRDRTIMAIVPIR
jgi:hypothetical protein